MRQPTLASEDAKAGVRSLWICAAIVWERDMFLIGLQSTYILAAVFDSCLFNS